MIHTEAMSNHPEGRHPRVQNRQSDRVPAAFIQACDVQHMDRGAQLPSLHPGLGKTRNKFAVNIVHGAG